MAGTGDVVASGVGLPVGDVDGLGLRRGSYGFSGALLVRGARFTTGGPVRSSDGVCGARPSCPDPDGAGVTADAGGTSSA